jgi:hypothetical protein
MKILKLFLSVFLFFSFSFNGCKATYPKEDLVGSIEKLCKKEVGKNVECIKTGKTLYTILYLDNMLDKEMKINDKTLDLIQNVMLSVNRVVLSTDAKIDFFVVIIADQASGMELIFTQYMDDLKRWMLGSISREDFFSRSLTEFSNHEKGFIFDASNLPEITLPIFISRQVSNLVKKELEKNVIMQILMNVRKVEGDFKNGYFEYLIDRIDRNNDVELIDLGTKNNNVKNGNTNVNTKENDKSKKNEIPQAFDLVKLIKDYHAQVVQKYKFSSYKGFIIKTDNKILKTLKF